VIDVPSPPQRRGLGEVSLANHDETSPPPSPVSRRGKKCVKQKTVSGLTKDGFLFSNRYIERYQF
jgi:hypothetical protein